MPAKHSCDHHVNKRLERMFNGTRLQVHGSHAKLVARNGGSKARGKACGDCHERAHVAIQEQADCDTAHAVTKCLSGPPCQNPQGKRPPASCHQHLTVDFITSRESSQVVLIHWCPRA
eukprot:5905864-Amphidinium_carterae.1